LQQAKLFIGLEFVWLEKLRWSSQPGDVSAVRYIKSLTLNM
jgi:hypothetical protein